MAIQCPKCGNIIEIQNESVQAIQCSCGTVIQNFAVANGERGFNSVPNLQKIREQQIKASKKQFRIFCVIYNFFLILLICMLVVLPNVVDSLIPIFTISPVILFMVVGEIVFIRSYMKALKYMGEINNRKR